MTRHPCISVHYLCITHYDRSRTGREFIVLVSCNSGVRRAEWVPCHAVNCFDSNSVQYVTRSNGRVTVAFMSFNLTFLTSVLTV